MRIEDQWEFDRPPETVLDLFTQRDYFVRKYERQGAEEIEVRACEDDGDRFSITVYRCLPPHGPLPGFVKKMVGHQFAIVQTDTWQRSSGDGTIDIEVHAAPVSIHVDMELVASGSGSRLALTFDVDVRVPLVRRRLEKFLAEDIRARVRHDLEETDRLLETGL